MGIGNILYWTIVILLLALCIFITVKTTIGSSTIGLFTINETTKYDITTNTVYLTVCDNIGKAQNINISSIFIDNALNQKIVMEDLYMNQSYVKNVMGEGNLSAGKYSKSNVSTDCLLSNITSSVVCTNTTHYYDTNNKEMICDNVLADKTCNTIGTVSLANETRYDYLPLPVLKQKIVTGGLKIEQKSSGIPLPKGGCVNLKYSYNHPVAFGNKPADTKYNISVTGDDGSNTILDPDWYSTSWAYFQTINITSSYKDLYNFSVMINLTPAVVGSGFLWNNSGDDLRFVDASNNTLNYWIENFTATSALNRTFIWIKMNLTNGVQSTIYMYYNNSAATSLSDGHGAFIYFDNASDSYRWANSSGKCVTSVLSGTFLNLNGAGAGQCTRLLNWSDGTNGNLSTNFTIEWFGWEQDRAGSNYDYWSLFGTGTTQYAYFVWRADPLIAGGTAETTVLNPSVYLQPYIFRHNQKLNSSYYSYVLNNSYVVWGNLNGTGFLSGTPVSLNQIRFGTGYSAGAANFTYLWIRAREFVPTDPTIAYGPQNAQTGGGVSTCTYSGSGDWLINCTEHCNITSTTIKGKLNITGSSAFECCTRGFSNITNITYAKVENCYVYA